MENEEKTMDVALEAPAPEAKQQPSKWKNFWRKQMVSLKRKPQRIGFWLYIICAAYYLLALGTYSQALYGIDYSVDWMGLMVFINVLFIILAVVLYLYSFPKLKKYGSKVVKDVEFAKGIKVNFNIVMIVLLLVFSIVIIVCNSVYYSQIHATYVEYWMDTTGQQDTFINTSNKLHASLNLSIADIVLVGVSMICACLTYVFGKLFVKVDTSIAVETSAENMGQIDLAEEE